MSTTNQFNNDYVQQLVFAGWIPAESLDDEYQEYLKTTRHHEEQFSYGEWQDAILRLKELGKFYDAHINPLYLSSTPLTHEQSEMEKRYWNEVSALECALGY